MRRGRFVPSRLVVTTLAAAALAVTAAATLSRPAGAQQGQPPHAFLFGEWTGGLFPVPSNISAQACAASPVVIFTRDVVMRATLTELTYTQREIATVRATGNGVEFRFTPAPANQAGGLLGLQQPAAAPGFGCDNPDVLHVQRRGENEIVFPDCPAFPNPLVRCPG